MKEWNEDKIDAAMKEDEFHFLYLYTPMCGTCQLAKKMLMVVNELLPNIEIGMTDLNYIKQKAKEWEIESVPCLLTLRSGELIDKIYAFHSVEYVYETLKNAQ